MSSNDEYVYELIHKKDDGYDCAKLMSEEFMIHDPLTRFHRISTHFFFNKISLPTINNVMNEGLSFLIRHRPSSEIVGALLAKDLYPLYNNYSSNVSRPPAPYPMLDLGVEMTDIFVHHNFDQKLNPCVIVDLSSCVIRAQHTGKGLATRLATTVCEHARDTKGFQYALIQVSNPASRHIFLNKLHGKIVSEIDLTTWPWKNTADGPLYPYKNYDGDPYIPNILIGL